MFIQAHETETMKTMKTIDNHEDIQDLGGKVHFFHSLSVTHGYLRSSQVLMIRLRLQMIFLTRTDDFPHGYSRSLGGTDDLSHGYSRSAWVLQTHGYCISSRILEIVQTGRTEN